MKSFLKSVRSVMVASVLGGAGVRAGVVGAPEEACPAEAGCKLLVR